MQKLGVCYYVIRFKLTFKLFLWPTEKLLSRVMLCECVCWCSDLLQLCSLYNFSVVWLQHSGGLGGLEGGGCKMPVKDGMLVPGVTTTCCIYSMSVRVTVNVVTVLCIGL